jgi:Flp pilus assembly pilin Flp
VPERQAVSALRSFSEGSDPADSRIRDGPYERRRKMGSMMQRFCQDESGQDLIEYTLLMAFVALASASLFIGTGGSISGIWGTASNQLSSANSLAS